MFGGNREHQPALYHKRIRANPAAPAEAEFWILYFQHLQNLLEKMYVHALHSVHALPDLRVAAGHSGGRCVT